LPVLPTLATGQGVVAARGGAAGASVTAASGWAGEQAVRQALISSSK